MRTTKYSIPVGVWMVEMLGLVAEETKGPYFKASLKKRKRELFDADKDRQAKAILEQHGYVMKPGYVGLNNKIFEHPNLTQF